MKLIIFKCVKSVHVPGKLGPLLLSNAHSEALLLLDENQRGLGLECTVKLELHMPISENMVEDGQVASIGTSKSNVIMRADLPSKKAMESKEQPKVRLSITMHPHG